MSPDSNLLLSAVSPSRATVIRTWLTSTFVGRAFLVGVAIKLVTLVLRATVGSTALTEGLDTAGSISLLVAAVGLTVQLFTRAKRVVLWRVRRKLTVSYIFIGFVPALLIITFFVVCGFLLFFNIGSYLLRSRLQTLEDQFQFIAESTVLELQRARSDVEFKDVLERRQAAASNRYPNASLAVVPVEKTCDDELRSPVDVQAPGPLSNGPWIHLNAPVALPAWVPCGGKAGLLAYTEGNDGPTRLAVRALAFPEVRVPRYGVVVDLPLKDEVVRQLGADTGVQIRIIVAIEGTAGDVSPEEGRPATGDSQSDETGFRIVAGPANVVLPSAGRSTEFEWATLLDYIDWGTGNTGTVAVTFRTSPVDTYQRISATSVTRLNNLNFGQVLLILLAVVGGLFLVIQVVAFAMGLTLARSITGAVHELFIGTERVRRGDFTHKIAVRSRDQLGELAESFNSMTASMEHLLEQKAVKERLEQELRIARGIQMSLLPQGPLTMPGRLELMGHCEPAREVGGDYFDFLPIDDHRVGILIADVAGKGTSAALYMAELKGIVLSLSQVHNSPRQLLMDANRILSRHLESRSFITMTYAVVDLQARTLTHARAGHCPLICLPGRHALSRAAQVHTPDGLVLGLQIEDRGLFDRLLVEMTLPLGAGDLFVFYTDGVSEAMNAEGDCFGESRLSDVLQSNSETPFGELRDRILDDVHAFVGSAAQQDDLTMVLLKVDDAWIQ